MVSSLRLTKEVGNTYRLVRRNIVTEGVYSVLPLSVSMYSSLPSVAGATSVFCHLPGCEYLEFRCSNGLELASGAGCGCN